MVVGARRPVVVVARLWHLVLVVVTRLWRSVVEVARLWHLVLVVVTRLWRSVVEVAVVVAEEVHNFPSSSTAPYPKRTDHSTDR